MGICLLFLCSCATPRVPPGLPPEVTFKQRSNPGEAIIITLNTEDGEPLPFVVDTGCTTSSFDLSVMDKLGKPVGSKRSNWAFYGRTKVNLYRTPELYLGKTRLLLPEKIPADDVQRYFGIPVKGVLGMDCLQHYCVQFDFAAHKMRFLNSRELDRSVLGKPFPLTGSGQVVFARVDIMGMKNVALRTDTGLLGVVDMVLTERTFKRGLQRQNAIPADENADKSLFKSTLSYDGQTVTNLISKQKALLHAGKTAEAAIFSTALFAGQPYRDIVFVGGAGQKWPQQNWLGLRFLSRHEVTFDFPNHTMYLRPETDQRLAGPPLKEATTR